VNAKHNICLKIYLMCSR